MEGQLLEALAHLKEFAAAARSPSTCVAAEPDTAYGLRRRVGMGTKSIQPAAGARSS